MAISYGGITLALSTPELDALQEAYLRRDQVREFENICANPADMGHLPFTSLPEPVFKDLGKLHWPRDASRYAYAHFAVSDRILALIRPLAYASDTLNALTLTISDGTRTISTDMSMLPPRPISQIAAPGVTGGNLWWLTLVDERYFWWYRAANISVVEGTTTWASLYGQIATGLDVVLMVDDVDAAYQKPTRRFSIAQQPLPMLLDAIAYSVGQRVTRQFDGTVLVQNYDSAKTIWDANYTALTNRGFGGKFFTVNTVTASGDMFALVPDTVRVAFPQQTISTGEIATVYTIDNTLGALALAEYPGNVDGFTGKQVLWGDQIAYASGGAPANLSNLSAYAAQLTADWYKWQLGGCDVSYSGVGDWEPEGITDSIEIIYDTEILTTRVQRGTWNDRAGGGLYRQDATGGGSFEVEEVDGSPSTTTILKFPNTSLTDNGDGTVLVKSASATEVGLVDLDDQVLGVNKKSVERLLVGNVDFATYPTTSNVVATFGSSDANTTDGSIQLLTNASGTATVISYSEYYVTGGINTSAGGNPYGSSWSSSVSISAFGTANQPNTRGNIANIGYWQIDEDTTFSGLAVGLDFDGTTHYGYAVITSGPTWNFGQTGTGGGGDIFVGGICTALGDALVMADISDLPTFGDLAELNAAADVDPLTDSTGGTPGATLNAVGDTSAGNEGPTINDNLASLNAKIDEIISALQSAGIMAS